ncbi:MAG: abortive infection system antitoxin AbiGi family protein [Bacteroidota bacterium]
MNNSSKSLFHFTDSIKKIKLILSDKFYGSICKENITFNNQKMGLYIPMISFCDIPLKTISHKTKYGKYGIGMSKDWAIRNGLNPVFYLEKNSLLASSLINSIKGQILISEYVGLELNRLDHIKSKRIEGQDSYDVSQMEEDISKAKLIIGTIQHLFYSFSFTKHVVDDLERKGKITRNYKFYDEREWRYVPNNNELLNKIAMSDKAYVEWRGNENKPFVQDVNLEFKSDDIEFIIVQKNTEKTTIINFIKALKNFSQKEKDALALKVFSFQQIKEEF